MAATVLREVRPSSQKRAKFELLTDGEMKSFESDHPDSYKVINGAYHLLVFGADDKTQTSRNLLFPLKITACNAFENKSFTDCACSVQQLDGGVRMFDVSRKGIDVLFGYLQEDRIPSDETDKLALRKLLTFFAKKQDAVLSSVDQAEDESEVCLFLMNHLVSRLSTCDDWRMDLGTRRRHSLKCPCRTRSCPVKEPSDDYFMDLSIGNTEVWHGCLDAMTLNELPVVTLGEGDHDDSVVQYESCCGLEFKDSTFKGKLDQLYGETIVYSFLQKMGSSKTSFVPILGLTKDAMKIAMYDVAQDVLLTTRVNKFSEVLETHSCVAYLIVWLTCNFKQFFTPPNVEALKVLKEKNTEFKRFASEKFSLYEDGLHFQKARRKKSDKELFIPALHTLPPPAPEGYRVVKK